jgi:hypothetical protein
MSRKPRPLTRDKATFRDDRLVLIACDDTYAPKQYFDFFELKRVKVHVVETTDGTSGPEDVLNRLVSISCEPDDERWLVLDTDHLIRGTHLATLTSVLQRARQSNVNIAISRPCFELWLLLHSVNDVNTEQFENATQVAYALRNHLGSYNKTRLLPAHYPLEQVVKAYRRAENLDQQIIGGEIPAANTTRVYLIWRSIFAISGAIDLPSPLRELANDLGYNLPAR